MEAPLKVLFFGSPESAIPSMREIMRCPELELLAVVTQPDRPSGRGRRLQSPPVKREALAAGLDALQPRSIRKQHVAWGLEAYSADIFAVVAYGKILPPRLLAMPRLGCVNLHFSLLPRYRGAAPVNWALINGEKVTGVTTMLMDEGLDTGPILLQQEVKIEEGENASSLVRRLAAIGAPLLTKTLLELAAGKLKPTPQDDGDATYAPLLKKEDGRIDWSWNASQIINRGRGLDPWPGIYSTFRGEQIKLLDIATAGTSAFKAEPGSLKRKDLRLFVACGEGTALELLQVQLPGKQPIAGADFANGYHISEGERLGE